LHESEREREREREGLAKGALGKTNSTKRGGYKIAFFILLV